jgi:dTDP-4-amino-4,6-dideoxy-D-galactose acyltransferase
VAEARTLDPCEPLEWDSKFFGFPIARVRGDSIDQLRARRIDAWCRANKIRCLYFLARSDDQETARIAEENGFRLVDVRTTLRHRASEAPGWMKSGAADDLIVRRARSEDIGPLQRIARETHRDTRFYSDGNFPERLCGALYETWIKVSCEGYANAVFLAEAGNAPIGYVTCHLNAKSKTGSIGLVGVSRLAQGRGVGERLVRNALEWFFEQGAFDVEVVTQGRNSAALRLYRSCGFTLQTVQHWYHKWYAQGDRS